MIKHIVLFRIQEYTSPIDKNNKALQIKQSFGELKTKIDGIIDYQTAINQGENPAAYDVCIDSTFASWEALHKYIQHPTHRKAIEKNKGIKKEKAVIDYAF